jgi:cytochrome c oxidase subunit 2
MTQRRLRRGGDRLRKLWVLSFVGLAALLVACTDTGPKNGQNQFRPKGRQAEKIDNLQEPIYVVAVLVGVFVLAATIFVALRYRHRPGRDDRPKQIHGSTPLEIGWTIVPALILAVIAVPTVSTIFDLNKETAPNAVEVTVIGKQWWWEFEYTNLPGTPKKVVTADELHIPVDRDVHLKLMACDESLPGGFNGGPGCNVIHSFWVPELNGKRDVVPGRVNTLTLHATQTGTFLGQCAEYCGLSHANMRFRVIAQSTGKWAEWVRGQQDGPAVSIADAGEAGKLFQTKYQCTACHTTEDSVVSTYGPNLTHLASRTTFASGYYELTKKKLVEWILDAPSLIPMESEECRLPPGPDVTCVGMPSFTKDTPSGSPVMTRAEAETIADYLLSLK